MKSRSVFLFHSGLRHEFWRTTHSLYFFGFAFFGPGQCVTVCMGRKTWLIRFLPSSHHHPSRLRFRIKTTSVRSPNSVTAVPIDHKPATS
ncbi:hypothetical protein C8J57DRAFT_321495 [Mycena rebaudengoi]|nr:hypothetical protein C8J57DRAFT_321495 [Mycena rebaudengoi]